MVFKPTVLIISNKHDYSTDHVVYQLEKFNIKYLRLNRDQFSEYELILDPINKKFYGKTNALKFEIDEANLKYIRLNEIIIFKKNNSLSCSFDLIVRGVFSISIFVLILICIKLFNTCLIPSL